MKTKFTHLKIFTFLGVIFFSSLQTISAQKINAAVAMDLIRKNAAVIGLSKTDLENFRISDAYSDKLSGATIVYLQQTYKGIDVFNVIQTVAFKNDKPVDISGIRIQQIAEIVNSKDGKALVPAANAVRATTAHLKLPVPGSVIPISLMDAKKEIEFGDMGISSEHIKSKLIWLPDDLKNTATLCWQVNIQPKTTSDYWLVNVDALKGTVISKINLNIVCNWNTPRQPSVLRNDIFTYTDDDDLSNALIAVDSAKFKVVPYPAESPIHPGGKPALKTNPWELAGAGNNATSLKWNDNGTVTYDSTRGNNVLAQEDRNGNNGLGKGAVSTTPLPNLTFNSKPKFNQPPTVSANQRFAIINLFYWNNIMHDISYQYGFDEVSGNFQANNQGRGGNGNDYVFADAQDGVGTNNANFSTPVDGSNPRMQMFLFNPVPSLVVNQPLSFGGSKVAVESAFSMNNKLASTGPITKSVILYNDDASGTSHQACGAAFNAGALAGKIALIDRGVCDFTVKVKNAQLTGALAVIIADDVPGEFPIAMGGTDNTITIPAVMVSFETADSIKQFLDASVAVNVTLQAGVNIDGDLDNGVISHEYTHGISNRLTGGPSNVSCLNNAEQAGEGWSDYMALMVTTNWSSATLADGPKARPLGTYVLGQSTNGPGIRTHPYSTDIAIDPWTYADLKNTGGEVHVIGEIWCTAVWEMTWDIIQQTASIKKNLYNANTTGGNIIALKLVMMGLKLQPCSPGFIDGRNAILKADTILYGGLYSASIWKAFAKRGMGINASQGSSNNFRDGKADFTEPPSAAPVANNNFKVLKQNSTALLQWQNLGLENSTGYEVERSSNGIDFKSIGLLSAGKNSNIYNFIDQAPIAGTNYYRVSQIAANGEVSYSDIRSLNFREINIKPNPAKDRISLSITGNTNLLDVSLLNPAGQKLNSYKMNGQSLQINLQHLAPGAYYMKIIGDNINETRKILIQ